MSRLYLRWRHALECVLVRFACWLIPRLSRRAVLALARAGGGVAFSLDGEGRRTGRENLRVVFPERSVGWRDAVLLRSYQSFARTMLDLFWSVNLTAETWPAWQHFTFDDPATESLAAAHGPFGARRTTGISNGWR